MKLALFDIDGTLTQSTRVDGSCFVQAFADVFGITGIDDDWSVYPHCTDSGILVSIFQERLGRPPEADEVTAFRERVVSHLRGAAGAAPLLPVPGARSLLDELLVSPEWMVAVASGAWEPSARLKLASAGLDTPMLPGAFAERSPIRTEIMLAARGEALRVAGRSSFEAVVYIGDGIWDARACRALGWPLIGIAADAVQSARLKEAGASAVFPHFLERDAFWKLLRESWSCVNVALMVSAAGR